MAQRFFNTAGPCRPEMHYMLPAKERLPEVGRLIDQQSYFVLHAPRQSGKTTAVLDLAQGLLAAGRHVAVMVSAEVGAAFNDDPGAAELAILSAWSAGAAARLPEEFRPPPWPDVAPGARIGAALRAWSEAMPRPLVIFIDEIDALENLTLISVLRQLRDGYANRPDHFPMSLALIGLRDVRDYKVATGAKERLNSASPFNIKVRSLTLADFTAAEVATLFGQHTADSGQLFTDEAVARAYYLTRGQPWLVNALAKVAVEELVPEPADPVTAEVIDAAKEVLICRRDTHLDSLAEKLREPRVRRVIEPMLAGETLGDVPADDRQYLLDLGLVVGDAGGGLSVANPIYREIIPRELAGSAQASLGFIRPTWLTSTGRLDPEALLAAFLAFWRQHGQALLTAAPYHEVAPQLVMMAFLHRVVNQQGRIEREYAIGTRRIDLCLTLGPDRLAIEMKVWRDGRRDPIDDGLAQLDAYLNGLDLDTGWLVIFDQRSGLPPIEDRTSVQQAETPDGRSVMVVRG